MKVLPVTHQSQTHIHFKNNFVKNTRNITKMNPTTTLGLPMAIICMVGVTKSKSNENTEDFKIREITNQEFGAKKAEILENKNGCELFKYIREESLTPYSVQLYDYMYQDCKGLMSDYPTHKDLEKEKNFALYKEYMHLQCDSQFRVPVENKDQAKVVLKMMKMPWLFASDCDGDYAHALNNAGYNIKGKKSAEIRNVKLKMLDELEKNREKYEAPTYDQIENISHMIAHVTTNRGLNVALKMIKHPELLNADQCDLSVSDFFKRISENKEQAKIVSEIIDKLVQKPELFSKEDFDHALTYMLQYPNNGYKKELVLKFIDNPALFDYEDFVYNMPGIISDFPSSESTDGAHTRLCVFETLNYYKRHPEDLKDQEPYKYPDFVYKLTGYCEPPDMSCPEWPISTQLLDAISENPLLIEDDDLF